MSAMASSQRRSRAWLSALASALLLGAWLTAAFTHLDFWAYEDDEGTFLVTARALFDGHTLYRDVWLNYFSGLMTLVQLAFRVGGVSVVGPRIAMALLAAATALLAADLARRLAGRLAGVLTVLLLVLTPAFSQMGRSVMGEVPAAACGALAAWSLLRHQRDARLGWVALAGLAAGLGVWFKYPTALLTAALLLSLGASWRARREPARALLGRAALLVGMALLPLAVDSLAHDAVAQWTVVGGTHLQNEAYQELNIPRNLDKFREYLVLNNWGLPALALLGLPLLARRHGPAAWLLGGWVGLYVAGMLTNRPLGTHHMYLLLTPLSILAALALTRGWALLADLRRGAPSPANAALVALVGAATLLWLLHVPGAVRQVVELYSDDAAENAERYHVSALVAAHTLPADYVVTDYPMIAFRAGRAVPPGLTNTSSMRFRTENLSDARVQTLSAAYNPAAVVFWEDKFTERAPDYVADIQARYIELYRNDKDEGEGEVRLQAVYLRPDRAPAAMAAP